jgi:hypothetical protein
MAESNGHDKLARDVEHNNRKIYALKAQIKEQAELVVDAHSRLEARKATISLVRAINDMTLVSFNNHMVSQNHLENHISRLTCVTGGRSK